MGVVHGTHTHTKDRQQRQRGRHDNGDELETNRNSAIGTNAGVDGGVDIVQRLMHLIIHRIKSKGAVRPQRHRTLEGLLDNIHHTPVKLALQCTRLFNEHQEAQCQVVEQVDRDGQDDNKRGITHRIEHNQWQQL